MRPETDGREEFGGIQGSMALGFVDLEKAFDSTHREGDGDATVDGSTRSGSGDG